MSTPINWAVSPGDPVLNHPVYQKYSLVKIADLSGGDITTDMALCLASNEAASIIAYLSWLKRTIEIFNL